MCSNAIKVLHKMRTAVSMTDDERRVLEGAILRFEGRRLFYEGKQAFNSGDVATAIERLRKSNTYLHSARVSLIVLLIRTVPTIARTAYVWRSRIIGA
jgi:hypothetical protein